ncbi:MAG TPA: calcium/sodium antiporter [Leucothrix mucor]|nr:calcium/sodium antiporter [Leucothrix mucor]
MLTFIAAILAGFVLLIWSADRFVDGAANIARNFGISPLIVGMLIIGLGTSAPEMLVSATAAFKGDSGLGIGNALGSNITNITMVLGATAILFALPVHSRLLMKEFPLIIASGVLAWVLMADGFFSRIDGAILLFALAVTIGWMILSAKKEAKSHDSLIEESLEELPEKQDTKSALIWTLIGLVLLLISSNLLVWGASNVAIQLGVSKLIIGLTIVAIGTSLPELAATISSARKGETDLAVGNIVGSNLFNTMAVLALPGLIHPAAVPEGVLSRDVPIMIVLSVLLLIFSIGCFKGSKFTINRWKGAILLLCFIAYEGMLYYQATSSVTA